VTEAQELQEQKQSGAAGPAGKLNQKRNPAGGLSSTKQKNEVAKADFAAGSRKWREGQFRSGEQIRWDKAKRKSSFFRLVHRHSQKFEQQAHGAKNTSNRPMESNLTE
jgi:hypothetical protein